jgi:hypothetical protein
LHELLAVFVTVQAWLVEPSLKFPVQEAVIPAGKISRGVQSRSTSRNPPGLRLTDPPVLVHVRPLVVQVVPFINLSDPEPTVKPPPDTTGVRPGFADLSGGSEIDLG